MIFDVIFIKIYRAKFPDPTYVAKFVLIILQSLILSSLIRLFIEQIIGVEYIEELLKNGDMKIVYLLPIIPSSIFTHFLYTERRVEHIVENFRRYSNAQLYFRLTLSICTIIVLIFLNIVINLIVKP